MQITRYPVTIDGETTHIGTAGELAIALDVLQGQRDRAVLEQLRDHLADVMGGAQGFARTLTSLAPDDQIFLIDAIGARLTGVIREARFLRDIFATMAVLEVEQKLLATLGGDGLRALIPTAEELSEILEWLYGECDHQALDLIGTPHLQQIIRHASDLAVVLNALNAHGQRDVIERLGWACITNFIRDGIDLALTLRALPAESSAQLLTEMTRERLHALIGNARDWEYLWHRLEPAEAKLVAEKLGVTYAA